MTAALAWVALLLGLLGPTRGQNSRDVVDNFRLSQNAMQQSWVDSPNWTCATPQVHGLVTKRAVGSQCASHPRNYNASVSTLYIKEGLPIFVSCQHFVSHKYKFIYVRQPKSSSTAMLKQLEATFCADSEHCTAEELVREGKIPDDAWRKYFVFTVIRNPFTRAASALDMFNNGFLHLRMGADGQAVGPKCQVGVLRFTQRAFSMREICEERGCCSYIGEFKRWFPDFVNPHVNDQYHCVHSMGGALVVDYIGRSEHIEEDWAEILDLINRRAGTSFQPSSVSNPNGRGGKVEHLCDAGKMKTFYNATTLRNVALQYAGDLVAFRYSLDSVQAT